MQNSENITVAIRVKPKKENRNREETVISVLDENTIQLSDSQHELNRFSFDYVFDFNTDQKTIFEKVAKNAVEWVSQGYNATIFAYGNTASGKTYTLFGGDDKNSQGIIPRSCEMLFDIIDKNDDVVEANMKCSFLEIYREQIRDLLKKDSEDKNLKLRYDTLKGVYVQNLIEKYVYSANDILETIREGALQRKTGSTALNSVSSRSHAVLTLTLTQKINDGSDITSKLHLIDLAGSENVQKSEVQGIALSEAQNINKSLSCLGNVIYALTEKGRDHIPYRDSKLTYLLQDSLGGNSKTILIATVSNCFSDTINTLKFAKRAKAIKNAPKINKYESTASLLQTIETLKQRILFLENELQKDKNTTKDIDDICIKSEYIDFLEIRCDSLENKVNLTEKTDKKVTEKTKELKDLFLKQRELCKKTSEELYNERLKNLSLVEKLEKFTSFYDSLKKTTEYPEITVKLIEKFKL